MVEMMDPRLKIREEFDNLQCPELISSQELTKRIESLLPLIREYLDHKSSKSHYSTETPQEVNNLFDANLPECPETWDSTVKFLRNIAIPRFPSVGNPHFFAYIPGDPAPPAMIGASLTPFFNQFVGTVIGSPGGTAIESLSIKWIIQMLQLDDSSWGSFTTGGSGANLACMYTGLVDRAPWDFKNDGINGNKRLMIYTSDQSHNCILKSAMLLGLGQRSVQIIETDESFRMTAETARIIIEKDEMEGNKVPALIVGTAGTTNTGAIDDLRGLSRLAREKELWFHIDGAYGAFARIANHEVARDLADIQLADSIALDAHKWLFAPFEAGCAIVSDGEKLRNAFELSAEYLKDSELETEYPLQRNFRSYGFPLTRELRGLKIWMLIRSYGKSGLSNLITRNILAADYLRQRVRVHPNLELMSDDKLGIVCFRWKGTDQLNKELVGALQERKKYYVSRTLLKGRITIRVCILNLRTTLELMDKFIEEIEDIFREIKG
ncbi:MAG: pyridoxal phosphate-dependent decarboxylase family protein [Candidatus Heimdallarchaeota archaeon]